MKIEPGALAVSLAGHDKGRYYIILADEGEYVSLADGNRRTVRAPKRKNKKHIQAESQPLIRLDPGSDEEIREKLNSMQKTRKKTGGKTDVEIRYD